MDKTETLKACPFCGGTEIGRTWLRATDDCQWFGVCCEACKATVERDTEAEAIAAWNERTPRPDNALADEAHTFARDYYFEFEDGRTYTPTDAERAMIEDAINAWEGRPF